MTINIIEIIERKIAARFQSARKQSFILSESHINLPYIDGVYLYGCTYDNANYHPNLFSKLGIQYVASLTNSVDSRKSEYLAGRYCVNNALKKLNIYKANIVPGTHRAPVWPSGIIGSISHTETHAIAAVTLKSMYTYLGVDIEKFISIKTANEIKSTIINYSEYQILISAELSFERSLTVAFSAKESLFKALYPYVGKYFDFTAAEIINFSNKTQSFELILQQSLTEKLTKGMLFKGWFENTDSCVFTIIAE